MVDVYLVLDREKQVGDALDLIDNQQAVVPREQARTSHWCICRGTCGCFAERGLVVLPM